MRLVFLGKKQRERLIWSMIRFRSWIRNRQPLLLRLNTEKTANFEHGPCYLIGEYMSTIWLHNIIEVLKQDDIFVDIFPKGGSLLVVGRIALASHSNCSCRKINTSASQGFSVLGHSIDAAMYYLFKIDLIHMSTSKSVATRRLWSQRHSTTDGGSSKTGEEIE